MAHLLEPLNPVALHLMAVGAVVEGAALADVPLAHVVAQQRLAMAGADDNAARVGHGLGAGHQEECLGAAMHAGPQGIGTQTEQQLEDALVGGDAYLTRGRRVVGGLTPGAQAPVFVVEEDAAEGHAGLLPADEITGDDEPRLALGHHVAPPYPGRDACQPREFEQTVGHAAPVAALDDNL